MDKIKLLKTNEEVKTEHAAGNFVRKEDKYLLNEQQAQLLTELMRQNLENASPIPNTEYTLIESVYYDNMNLDILTEYLARQPVRSKIRTRRYGPNGNWSSNVFIEVKAKENGICNKTRFQIGMNEVVDLTLGKKIVFSEALCQINSSIKTRSLKKRIASVNHFSEKLNTIPSSKIVYSRLAYEKGNFRVTLDRDLNFKNQININEKTIDMIRSNTEYVEIMQTAQMQYASSGVILEVKHAGEIPLWMQNFLTENSVAEVGFSKYCFAMSFAVAGNLTDAANTSNAAQKLSGS